MQQDPSHGSMPAACAWHGMKMGTSVSAATFTAMQVASTSSSALRMWRGPSMSLLR